MEASVNCLHCFEEIDDEIESSILCKECACCVHLKCSGLAEEDDLQSVEFLCKVCDSILMDLEIDEARPPPQPNIQIKTPPTRKRKSNENMESREFKQKKLADKKEVSTKAFLKYITVEIGDSGSQIYKCQQENCGFDSISLNDSKKHAQGHEKPLNNKRKKKLKKKHNCSMCNETFDKKKNLKIHWSQHHAQNECSLCTLCGKEFKGTVNLRKHLQTVHVQSNFVSCTHCTKSFKNQFEMHRHVNSVHKEKQFCCDECTKVFTTKRNLNMHYKKVHESRSFECDCCEKLFYSLYHLKRHQNSKIIEKKKNNNVQVNQCLYCDKTFVYKTSLQRHIRLIHLKENRFMCEICSQTFQSTFNLKRHASDIHQNTYENSESNPEDYDEAELDLDNNVEMEISEEGFNQRHSENVDTSGWKFITSNLDKSSTTLVARWIASLDCKGIGKRVDDETTHVIVGTGINMEAERTLKYLQGVASGKLVVSHLWIEEAMRCHYIPDTKEFEVKDKETGGRYGPLKSRLDKEGGNAGILSRFEFLVNEDCEDLAKDDVTDLIERAGGRVVMDTNDFSFSPLVTGLIIADSIVTMDVNTVVNNLRDYHLPTVEKDWLLESLGEWSLRPLLPYMIGQVSENDLNNAGYNNQFNATNNSNKIKSINNCETDTNVLIDNVNVYDYIQLDDYVKLDENIDVDSVVVDIIESMINDVFDSRCPQQWGFNTKPFENFLDMKKDAAVTNICDPNYLIKCRLCEDLFSSNAYLVIHMKTKHLEHDYGCLDIKHYTFPCDICGKKFTRNTILKKHKINVHDESDELFKCKHCGLAFNSRYLLNEHYPCFFKCNYCDYESIKQKLLQKHMVECHEKKM